MRFRHPLNGHIESGGGLLTFIWCLLFGPLFFAVRGIWGHAVVSLVLAISTAGLSWLIYPFFAPLIIERHYLRAGWSKVAHG